MLMLFGQQRVFSNWILEWFHDDHDLIINVVVEYVSSANNNNVETVRILSSHFRQFECALTQYLFTCCYVVTVVRIQRLRDQSKR